MMKEKIFIGVIVLGISSLAFASGDKFTPPPKAKTFTPGIYVGIQGGYSLADWNSIVNENTPYQVKNYNDFGIRGYLGFDWLKNLAIEAGYTQLFNKPKLTNTFTNPVTTYQPSTFGTYAIDLALKLKAPITDDFGLYAKVGGDYLSTDAGIDGKDQSGFNALFGLGATYYFTPQVAVDFSWTRYNGVPDLSKKYLPTYDLFAAGISYKFNIG